MVSNCINQSSMTITWFYLEISSLSSNLKTHKKSMSSFLRKFHLTKDSVKNNFMKKSSPVMPQLFEMMQPSH